jgi:hypothetical protein
MKLNTSLALIAAVIAAGPARAGEKKIEKSAVPAAVLEAVARKYPKARMVAFEQAEDAGKVLYEVGIEMGNTKMDVELAADGRIAVEETVIPRSALPAAVTAGLAASKYKGWKVQRVEKVIKEEKTEAPLYELVVQSKTRKFEVVFDQAGAITEEEDRSGSKGND